MAVAFSSGGYPQPPAKIFKRTHVSSEQSGAHPTTEEAQLSAVADLIIPPELVPIKKALTATIEASGNFDEHEFKVAIAYTTYAEWRRTKSFPELPRVQQSRVYNVLQGLLAMYDEEVPVAWFRTGKINVVRAKKLYETYCRNRLRLGQLEGGALIHLAWAIREQQQSGEGHFLPHAQRYLEELKDLLCGTNTAENSGAFERAG